ncbi:MAG: inositol monophosphatase [Deltaproteobacteria bacterium]|nr:MAG: inositol monophosphatase [Deltaproteobacteria bacterium]
MEAFERVARAAVADASALLRSTWRKAKTIHHKGAVDIVTETDHAVEALVIAHLRRAFPDHAIVAEESSSGASLVRPAADVPVWYLDPLDGTTNFAHAYPHFAVSLALGRGPDLLFGIVHDPIRNETFVAERGRGARLNDEPIGVSSTAALDAALLATGFPYDRREHVDFYLGFLADFVARAQGVRRNGSAALDLCYVACGRLDAFWEWKLHPWDTAAGALIVREAQGTVSDFRGATFDLFGEQTLASNGALHPEMVRVLTTRLDANGGTTRRTP